MRYDFRQNLQEILVTNAKSKPKMKKPNQRPVCLDLGCVWFCRLIGSIATVAICYCCAYRFITDTKLKFGLFMP
ncbi:jg19002 [Pararge aegeria aegeria]|uniref:Jg19002 protein n=1 Tax=Pararge aegeria aegeria TaxID=348720 RepID=A0A8S4RDZ9_9NEOP|nr:jg19002 [Pararge aegeria aegeria]